MLAIARKPNYSETCCEAFVYVAMTRLMARRLTRK